MIRNTSTTAVYMICFSFARVMKRRGGARGRGTLILKNDNLPVSAAAR